MKAAPMRVSLLGETLIQEPQGSKVITSYFQKQYNVKPFRYLMHMRQKIFFKRQNAIKCLDEVSDVHHPL